MSNEDIHNIELFSCLVLIYVLSFQSRVHVSQYVILYQYYG